METVIDILETLESTSGSNAKRDILVMHKDNSLLRDVFAAAQDPYTVYFVNKFKMPLAGGAGEGDDDVVDAFLAFLKDDLSTRRITGNAAKDSVIAAFSIMTELQQKWCLRILIKNLRCGVQETTVNKIWPGLIKGFDVQLATTLGASHDPQRGIVLEDRPRYPVRVEPKLDGLRCVAVKQGGKVTMFTRNGTELDTEGLKQIKIFLESANYDNFVLDGELLDDDGTWNSTTSLVMKGRKI